MLFELRVIPSVVEEVSIAGSMSDSMEERGDGGIMMLVVAAAAACATFGRRRMTERRHDVTVTSGAILLRLLSAFLTC